MKNIIQQIYTAVSLLLLFTLLLGVLYPLLVAALTQLAFNDKSHGSLIEVDGKIAGSQLLGQNFAENKYFWGRLSASNYNAAHSEGTNLSLANPKLLERVNARVEALHKADPANKAKIPVELVTSSGSGLDPHISLLAAEYQMVRIAKLRGVNEDVIQSLITDNIDVQSKIFGSPYVNVLELNLALDNMAK